MPYRNLTTRDNTLDLNRVALASCSVAGIWTGMTWTVTTVLGRCTQTRTLTVDKADPADPVDMASSSNTTAALVAMADLVDMANSNITEVTISTSIKAASNSAARAVDHKDSVGKTIVLTDRITDRIKDAIEYRNERVRRVFIVVVV